MTSSDATVALRWLAGRGITPAGGGRWREVTAEGVRERTNNDVAHELTYPALFCDDVPPRHRLRVGLGLLDLLDEYWVTAELRHFLTAAADPALTDAFWAGYRARLEAVEPLEKLHYSLWVDWFEDPDTAEAAFAAVLGDSVRNLPPADRGAALASGPLHRRAVRVLENSGPVRWIHKHDVYEAVVTVPEIHPALFKALQAGYHDIHGDLDPPAALTLLGRMDIRSENAATLTAVLETGAANHYRDATAWNDARERLGF